MKRLAWLVLVLGGCRSDPLIDDIALEKYEEANRLHDAGRYEEAIPSYEYTVQHRDRIIEAYHRLADCHLRLGHPERALEVLRAGRRADPAHPGTLRAMGQLYVSMGRLPEARDVYSELVRMYPSDTAAREELQRLKGMRKP